MNCTYCDQEATRTVKISESQFSAIKKDKRVSDKLPASLLRRAAQEVKVCDTHHRQLTSALRRGQEVKEQKKAQRQSAIRGQMTIEDYLI